MGQARAEKLETLFQVECHPYLNQPKLIAFCKARGIVVTAYAPFGRPGSKVNYIRHDVPSLLEDPTLKEIATKRGKTVAQVILRYLVSSNISYKYIMLPSVRGNQQLPVTRKMFIYSRQVRILGLTCQHFNVSTSILF
jgi:diketogulonate reductase-like aldo/keto reductase